MSFDTLVARPAFGVSQAVRERLMLPELRQLTRHHQAMCPPYARILERVWPSSGSFQSVEELPFLPVGLFKQADLRSSDESGLVLRSSGTTGQVRSSIFVDPENAQRQSRALVATMKAVLGEMRMPLLLIDTRTVISDPGQMTARGAGVLGMMKFGARPTFALDAALDPDLALIRQFVEANAGRPIMLFGFTFLVWTKLYESFRDGALDLSNAIRSTPAGGSSSKIAKCPMACFARHYGAVSASTASIISTVWSNRSARSFWRRRTATSTHPISPM